MRLGVRGRASSWAEESTQPVSSSIDQLPAGLRLSGRGDHVDRPARPPGDGGRPGRRPGGAVVVVCGSGASGRSRRRSAQACTPRRGGGSRCRPPRSSTARVPSSAKRRPSAHRSSSRSPSSEKRTARRRAGDRSRCRTPPRRTRRREPAGELRPGRRHRLGHRVPVSTESAIDGELGRRRRFDACRRCRDTARAPSRSRRPRQWCPSRRQRRDGPRRACRCSRRKIAPAGVRHRICCTSQPRRRRSPSRGAWGRPVGAQVTVGRSRSPQASRSRSDGGPVGRGEGAACQAGTSGIDEGVGRQIAGAQSRSTQLGSSAQLAVRPRDHAVDSSMRARIVEDRGGAARRGPPRPSRSCQLVGGRHRLDVAPRSGRSSRSGPMPTTTRSRLDQRAALRCPGRRCGGRR